MNETFDLVETNRLPTESEIKAFRRMNVTIRNPEVQECGHKFNGEPRNNCEWCWFAFFNHYGDMTKVADELFQKEGETALIAIKGKKFTKNFKKFMATVAQFVQEQTKEENGNSTDPGATEKASTETLQKSI